MDGDRSPGAEPRRYRPRGTRDRHLLLDDRPRTERNQGQARVPAPGTYVEPEGSEIDEAIYPRGTESTDQHMSELNIERDPFHGDWNYTIHPKRRKTPIDSIIPRQALIVQAR